MQIKNPILVQCRSCSQKFNVKIDFECVSQDERNMDTECQYESLTESSCPHCGNDFRLMITIWEYPIGALNLIENKTDGVDISEDINVSF